MTELIDRYLQRLQAGRTFPIHPEVERISGLVPSEVDVEVDYHEDLRGRECYGVRSMRLDRQPERCCGFLKMYANKPAASPGNFFR